MVIDREEKFKVHLGVYGSVGWKILDMLRRRIARDERERRRKYDRSFTPVFGRSFTEYVRWSRETDNDVVIEFSPSFGRYRWKAVEVFNDDCILAPVAGDPAGVKLVIADMVEAMIPEGSRNDVFSDAYAPILGSADSTHGAKVKELILLVKFLRGEVQPGGQQLGGQPYPEKIWNRVIGSAADPVQSELSLVLAEEISKLEDEFAERWDEIKIAVSKDIYDAQREMWRKQNAATNEYNKRKRELQASAKAQKAELDKQFRAAVSRLKKSMKS